MERLQLTVALIKKVPLHCIHTCLFASVVDADADADAAAAATAPTRRGKEQQHMVAAATAA